MFRDLAKRYKFRFGVPCEKNIRLQGKYKDFCKQHGENMVLSAFDEWATANIWRTNPVPSLWFFFKECNEWIEDIKEAKKTEQAEKKTIDEEEQAMIADRVAARVKVLREIEEQKKEKEAISKLPPDAF